MVAGPREGDRELTRLLDEFDALHAELQAGCLAVRAAVVARDNPAVVAGVKVLRQVGARRRTTERAAAAHLRALGWLAPAESFSLARLVRHAELAARPRLRRRVERALATAAGAQRAAAINRRLIERLSDWLRREAAILLESAADCPGYGANGARRPGATRPAVLDQRG